VVKKSALSDYRHIRVTGVNAINIDEGDELIDVQITGGDDEVILATHEGMAIRFHEADVRQMGRATRGVRGIRLGTDNDRVVAMVIRRAGPPLEDGGGNPIQPTLLVVSERGMGKRSLVDDYRLQGRGGKGVINLNITEKTGNVVAVKGVNPGDEVVMITRGGVVNRQPVGDVRVIGRNTQGVRLINLDDGDEVMDVARLKPDEETDEQLEGEAGEPLGLDEELVDDQAAVEVADAEPAGVDAEADEL
jgi:DNA gyrase subunit A